VVDVAHWARQRCSVPREAGSIDRVGVEGNCVYEFHSRAIHCCGFAVYIRLINSPQGQKE
jgi:hypothetical protein